MKKTVVLLLVMTVFAAALYGCGGDASTEAPDISELSEELQNEIKQTRLDGILARDNKEFYKDATLDDVRINMYYGTYNDSVVMMISDSFSMYTQALRDERIAGVKFRYTTGQGITVWNDGAFYSLEDAYKQKLLTRKDLKKIAAIQNDW